MFRKRTHHGKAHDANAHKANFGGAGLRCVQCSGMHCKPLARCHAAVKSNITQRQGTGACECARPAARERSRACEVHFIRRIKSLRSSFEGAGQTRLTPETCFASGKLQRFLSNGLQCSAFHRANLWSISREELPCGPAIEEKLYKCNQYYIHGQIKHFDSTSCYQQRPMIACVKETIRPVYMQVMSTGVKGKHICIEVTRGRAGVHKFTSTAIAMRAILNAHSDRKIDCFPPLFSLTCWLPTCRLAAR